MSNQPERKYHLKEFKTISHAISTYEDLNLLINHFAEGLSRTFEIKGCCIMLLDEREKQLFNVSSYGISDTYLNKGPIVFNDENSAFCTGKPVHIDDLQSDPRVQYPEAAAEENINAMLTIPIKSRETVVGLIRMYHSAPLKLHEEDLDSICILARHLGLLIENNGLANFVDGVKVAIENLPLRMLKGL